MDESLREHGRFTGPDNVSHIPDFSKTLKPEGDPESTLQRVEGFSAPRVVVRDERLPSLEIDFDNHALYIRARECREPGQVGNARLEGWGFDLDATGKPDAEVLVTELGANCGCGLEAEARNGVGGHGKAEHAAEGEERKKVETRHLRYCELNLKLSKLIDGFVGGVGEEVI